MSEAVLEIKDLCFSYDKEKLALDHVNLIVNKGEKIAVLGNNGAGKSTFFLNINGVKNPNSGTITCYGREISKKNRKLLRQTVGIVFQDADTQLIAASVKDDIAFGPVNMKLSSDRVREKTDKAISDMNLEGFEKRPPHYLSGGEKKRVTIAGILAMETDVMVFDEPTASLDPVNTEMFEKTIDMLYKHGKTILISTHDIDFAYRFADRVIIFSKGKVIADGSVYDVFSKENVLREANLKKPFVYEMYEFLKSKGRYNAECKVPKSFDELKKGILL